jgi:dTMP kinase
VTADQSTQFPESTADVSEGGPSAAIAGERSTPVHASGRSKGRLIAFEGVDGAGKTTALARVAALLRSQGVSVFLPRTGKEHSSRPTRMIRQLTRDPRNFELSARAELLLYCAREAQVMIELVQPALARGETVLVDRSFLTPVVLGMARGLAHEECEAAARLGSGLREPDLTLVFDVHPRTSRLRKRLERIRTHTLGDSGRKGLAGSAFKERVRDLYGKLASERRYPLFHVERASPDELAARVSRVVLHGPQIGTGESAIDAEPRWLVPREADLARALESQPLGDALYFGEGLIVTRALRARALESEPALVAYTLDPDDPLREAAAELEPEYALRGLYGKPLTGPEDLRMRILARAPRAAILALRYLQDEVSDTLRERYLESEPDAVLSSLALRDDPQAWLLRERAWDAGSDEMRAQSLIGCVSARAGALRERLFDKNPLLALASLRSTRTALGDAWLTRTRAHAPKLVLAALAGRTDDFAHDLREELFETGREVIDPVRRLDDARSFALRERAVARWPSTVLHSLFGLQPTSRVTEMQARCRELGAGDIHMLRRAQLLGEQDEAPTWAERERSIAEVGP